MIVMVSVLYMILKRVTFESMGHFLLGILRVSVPNNGLTGVLCRYFLCTE